jgi:hypothetical protein
MPSTIMHQLAARFFVFFARPTAQAGAKDRANGPDVADRPQASIIGLRCSDVAGIVYEKLGWPQ